MSQHAKRLFFSIISLFGVISCQSNNLIGSIETFTFESKCYELQLESFLFTLNYCSDDEKCYGIQSYAVQEHYPNHEDRNIPSSRNELVNDLNYWNRKINEYANVSGFEDSKYTGTLEKLTTLRIVRIEYNNILSFGSFWTIEAKITSGQHKGKIIHFPDQFYLMSPSWIEHSQFEIGPVWNKRFITSCT